MLSESIAGDRAAAARLMPMLYDQLRALAHKYLPDQSKVADQTLQPTALVHEAFLRLVDKNSVDVNGRTHFFSLAAVAMRHVLIDHARSRKRAKRGGAWQRITLTYPLAVSNDDQVDLLDLDEKLTQLSALDERAARVVELRFFAGLSEADIAGLLGVSERTVRNDWSMARAWLRSALEDDS